MHAAKGVFEAPSTAHLMIHVARKIPTKWYQVGIMLEIETATLDTLEVQITDPVRLFMKVFDQWKREEKVPFTWDTIISTLELLSEKKTTTEIKKWLNEQVSR